MNTKALSATIVNGAKKVFLKKGYAATNVEDIVKTAQISAREFEDCFNSIEEVGLKVLQSYRQELKKQLKKYEENDNPRQRLSMFLDSYFDDAERLAKEGCPVFSLYYDVRNMGNALTETAVDILEIQHKWIDEQFIIMLKTESGVDQGDRLMSAICGLTLLAKLTGNAQMFKNQIIQLRSWIRSM